MVIGTTGLSPEQGRRVEAAAKRVPIVWSANMSLGVNILLALVERTAQLLDPANWVDGDLVATGIQATGSFTNADGQTFNIYQTKSGGTLNVDADVEVFV